MALGLLFRLPFTHCHSRPHSGVRQASRELGFGLADVCRHLRQEQFYRAGELGLDSILGHQERLPGGGVPEPERAVWKLLPFLVSSLGRLAHSSLNVLLPQGFHFHTVGWP